MATEPPSGQSRGVFLLKSKKSHKRQALRPTRNGFSTTAISFTCSCSGWKQRLPDLVHVHSHICLAAESTATSSSTSGPFEPPSPPPTHVSSVPHILRLNYRKCVFQSSLHCVLPLWVQQDVGPQPRRSPPKTGEARALRWCVHQNPRGELHTFSCTSVSHTDMISLPMC